MSRYFDSDSRQPMLELGLHPTMLLAALDVQQSRALIERGIVADGTAPKGTAYLVNTGDAARNISNDETLLGWRDTHRGVLEECANARSGSVHR